VRHLNPIGDDMSEISKLAVQNEDGAPELSPEQVKEHQSELSLVDVRRSEEYTGELGHIENASLSTLETDLEAKLDTLDKSKAYVFVCRSGKRSTAATLMAQQKGFSEVYNLKGGMLRWNALGLPVTKS